MEVLLLSENKNSAQMDTLPRPGSIMYDITYGDKETRRKIIRRFKLMNKYLTIPLYRVGLLPLFGFGRLFLLLYTEGRKSGKTRITPLEYHRIDGVIHIFSSRGRNADWFKNLIANPREVRIRVGFKKFKPKVEIVEDKTEKEEIMKWYVKKHPKYAKTLMGWDPKKDDPETVDFSNIISQIEIIRLHESEKD